MQSQRFVKVEETYNLSTLGVSQDNFKFGQVFFESEKFITIKQNTENGQKIILFNLEKKQVMQHPNNADSAIMNPITNIIALKSFDQIQNQTLLQIFNLEEKYKLRHIQLDEPIVFWRWVNPQKLAYVTTTAIYHVDITNPNEQSVKIRDRLGQLSSECPVQIIGYILDNSEVWCALYGISKLDDGKTIQGHIQLINIEKQIMQPLYGYCCCFGEAFIHKEDYKSDLFCFVEKRQDQEFSRLHILEIGIPPEDAFKFKMYVDIETDQNNQFDFTLLMHINQNQGLVYLINISSFLSIYELKTAKLIYKSQICNEKTFLGTPNFNTHQYHIINKAGMIYTITVDDDQNDE